jgi:hypothetical protein
MFGSHLRSVLDQLPENLEGTQLSRCWDPPRSWDLPGSTSAGLFLDCELPEEVPCFTPSKRWELWPAPGSVVFDIDQEGLLNIYPSDSRDGVPIYAQIQIESFVELQEASEAFLNPQPPPAPGPTFASLRLSALVEDIYYPVLIGKQLRLVAWAGVADLFPGIDLRERTAKALTGQTAVGDEYDDSWDYARLVLVNPEDPRFIPCSQRDILVLGTGCICAAAAYDARRMWSNFGLVLRLTSKASILFLLDVFRHSLDGAKIREELAAVKSSRDWLKTKEISAPRNRLLQIHQSIAFRHSRQAYLNEVANLSYGRDPLEAAPDLFAKRREMVRSLHNEMLLQVESLVRPLPFFIEYPYAQFIGTADRAQRIRHAQFVLNVLCKMMILLPLEELQHQGDLPEDIQKLVTELRGLPFSDGMFLNFNRMLSKTVESDALWSRLRLFGGLVGDSGNNLAGGLGPLVAARNRAHHPPYDEKGFLDVAATALPDIISQLREMFRNLELIVPKQVQPTREKVTVLAMRVMGENPSFRSFELKTSLPAGDFIVDELAAYRSDAPEVLVPLNHWFVAKTFSAESLDVGLFDRMGREGPTYSYITH